MKVAINRCYGGFSVSEAAQQRLIELKCPHVHRLGMKPYDGYDHEASIEHRSCPMLIQVVEELGEKADGAFANIVVVDVPDGVSAHLDDYDGVEHVAEDHRTWP